MSQHKTLPYLLYISGMYNQILVVDYSLIVQVNVPQLKH